MKHGWKSGVVWSLLVVVMFGGAVLLCGCGEEPSPTITTHPANLTVLEELPAVFTVAASGSGTLIYRWRRDGLDIPGATGTTYEIAQATVLNDNGVNFTCVVTNAFGNVESSAAMLTVIAPALFINGCGQSVAGELTVGISVRFQGSYGPSVTDADVTLNGISIPYDGASAYRLSPIVGISPGDDVTLQVVHWTQNVSATVLMPEKPLIISPTPAGSPYDAMSPIPVQWAASSPSPDQVVVYACEQASFSGTGWSGSGTSWFMLLDGAETGTEIPVGTFSSSERFLPGTDTALIIRAANRFESINTEANLTLDIANPNMGAFTTQD